ncbi:hypothetical protein [Staphylococcus hominis]|uniref:hypothetical protein n=1 Tax=Staphylococcus hominis TaxID=1290 RepID=UPI0001EF5125|nr:hypothetical protein [Staphylococcus hominis]EFS19029.1 putative lipoprotein [Staphylococcus hominis subsp. hominis C80]
MKKFLALIFSSALILGACGNDDTSNKDSDTKSENKTEKKSEDKKDNKSKEDKKSKEEKKSQENEDNKSKQEDNSTEELNTQETATSEQVQSQQQTQETATQEQQQTQQANNGQQQSDNHEPTKEKIYEWDKENIPRGTDYGLIDPEDVNEQSDNSQSNDSNTNYDPNNPYMNIPDQEWRNNTGDGLSSGEKQLQYQIEQGEYDGNDGQQILDALDYYQDKYGN